VEPAVQQLRAGRLRGSAQGAPGALARLLGGLADAGARRRRLQRFAAHHLAGGAGGRGGDPVLKARPSPAARLESGAAGWGELAGCCERRAPWQSAAIVPAQLQTRRQIVHCRSRNSCLIRARRRMGTFASRLHHARLCTAQAFAAAVQRVLRRQSAALQALPAAVAARRAVEARVVGAAAAAASATSPTSPACASERACGSGACSGGGAAGASGKEAACGSMTLLEVDVHTRPLRSALAALAEVCGCTSVQDEQLDPGAPTSSVTTCVSLM